MESPCLSVLSDASSVVSGQPDFQCNMKRKKRGSSTDNTDTSSSTDSSLNVAQGTTSANKNTEQCRAMVNQRRSLGPPVIVQPSPKTLEYRIPQILRQNHELRYYDDTCDAVLPRTPSTKSKKSNASIIVANCGSPTSRQNNATTAISSKNRPTPRKTKKLLTSDNVNTVKMRESNESSVPLEECLQDIQIGNDNANSSSPNTRTSTLQKNQSAIQGGHCPVQFYCFNNKVVAIMPRKAQFNFTGKIVLKVVFGAVEVYKSLITASSKPVKIYSPRGYSSVFIKNSEKTLPEDKDIGTSLSAECIDQNMENKLIADLNNLEAGAAVLLLWNLENKLTKFLNFSFPFQLFPRVKNMPYRSSTDLQRVEAILQSNIYTDMYACKSLVVDSFYTCHIAENMLNNWRGKKRSCALVAGGKSMGKSSWVRFLINNLLPASKNVILVDLDIGQAECTPAGCISYSLIKEPLLGPNFTHLQTPVYQLYIGEVDVTRCITSYIEGMKMLVNKLSNCPVMSRLPIVVNTAGFTHGIGWNIMLFTIKLIKPTNVIQIQSERAKDNFPDLLTETVVNNQKHLGNWKANVSNWNQACKHKLTVLSSYSKCVSGAENETETLRPRQKRELLLMSYFSNILRSPIDPMHPSNGLSLNDAVPYVTSFSSIIVSIPRASAPASHALKVINGNIVALCGIDLEESDSQPSLLIHKLRVLDRVPLCSCYGFGFVRGVDMEREEIFINTPLPLRVMPSVNCIVGCVPMPESLLQRNRHGHVPYTGGNNQVPTSWVHRRGFFRPKSQGANANS